MPRKNLRVGSKIFFLLLPLFVVHLSLHWRSVYFAQENEGPKRHCSACKVFVEGARGREGQALSSLLKQSGLFLLLLCPMDIGPDAACADIAGPWTSKVGSVKG